jgi:hypothetical protein
LDESQKHRVSSATEWFWDGAFHVAAGQKIRHQKSKLAKATGYGTEAQKDQGYFAIARDMVSDVLKNAGDQRSIYIIGYSKGGGMAQLVSMWLKKSRGKEYQTYAFDPVGVQCFGEKLYGDYIDVRAPHPHIHIYADAYSHYAALDYHVGHVCVFGSDTTRRANEWCRGLVGYPGSMMLAAPAVLTEGQKCRYFVHNIHIILYHLTNTTSPYYLNEDGTTDGKYGWCFNATDETATCRNTMKSYTRTTKYHGWVFVFFILLPITVCCSFSACVYFPLRLLCLKMQCCGHTWFPCFSCKSKRTDKAGATCCGFLCCGDPPKDDPLQEPLGVEMNAPRPIDSML